MSEVYSIMLLVRIERQESMRKWQPEPAARQATVGSEQRPLSGMIGENLPANKQAQGRPASAGCLPGDCLCGATA
jgi:hypothetical protein